MAIFEFSDEFDAMAFYMDHPSAMGDDYYWGEEPEEEEDGLDRDYWENMAEDALMEHYLGLDA